MPEINAAIAHVRQILGDASYESLVRKGEGMATGAALAYAYDQIDHARATLDAVSEWTTSEGRKTSCRRCHGDMTDIVDQR